MPRDSFLLLFDIWIVDHQGDGERSHKKNRERQQAGDQCGHQSDSQQQVKPLKSGALERCGLRIGRRCVINRNDAEPLPLFLSEDISNGDHPENAGDHSGNQRRENL